MRPDARAQSAIEILDEWLGSVAGLDRTLTRWARGNRFAGSKDRAAIADLVYGVVRRLRSSAWISGCDPGGSQPVGRQLLLGSLVLDGVDPELCFTGAKYAPEKLTAYERTIEAPLEQAPRAIRLDYPDWLDQHLADVADADLEALRSRAPLDLRVNSLKASVAQATVALAADGIEVQDLASQPLALRVTVGERKVAGSTAYKTGLVEIQDVGSQGLSTLAETQPKEVVIDLCAGGGGKALAIAAQSAGLARIYAYDISLKRMAAIPERAERAGVEIELLTKDDLAQMAGKADLVFLDAPCSGSGAWRRNPDAKWRLTPERLSELTRMQSELLYQATGLCRPGGRIVYGTCSILRAENQMQTEAFSQKLTN